MYIPHTRYICAHKTQKIIDVSAKVSHRRFNTGRCMGDAGAVDGAPWINSQRFQGVVTPYTAPNSGELVDVLSVEPPRVWYVLYIIFTLTGASCAKAKSAYLACLASTWILPSLRYRQVGIRRIRVLMSVQIICNLQQRYIVHIQWRTTT